LSRGERDVASRISDGRMKNAMAQRIMEIFMASIMPQSGKKAITDFPFCRSESQQF
jgi:hypothetical protein